MKACMTVICITNGRMYFCKKCGRSMNLLMKILKYIDFNILFIIGTYYAIVISNTLDIRFYKFL